MKRKTKIFLKQRDIDLNQNIQHLKSITVTPDEDRLKKRNQHAKVNRGRKA